LKKLAAFCTNKDTYYKNLRPGTPCKFDY